MGSVTFPYIISNPIVLNSAMLNGDFNAVSAQVNANLEEGNVSELAHLTGATVTATEIKTKEIDPSSTLVIKLPSSDGSHSLRIKDYLGQTRVEVKSSGEVTFF